MADYDAGEITDREQEAANKLKDIKQFNDSTTNVSSQFKTNTVNRLADYNKDTTSRVADFNKTTARNLADYNSKTADNLKFYNTATANNTANYNKATEDRLANYNRNSAKTLSGYSSDIQKKLAKNNASAVNDIANYNAESIKKQVDEQLGNYDFADRQNQSLRDVQLKQASRKSEAERFEAQRNLQNAALGLLGSMNQAMNGSTIGNAMHMFNNRNDSENSVYWQQLADNRNAIRNAYDESYNQNQVAKLDAITNARKAVRDIQGDLSANLNNIQGDLSSNLGNIRSDLLSTLSNVESDLYANKRNIESDRYNNVRNINSDWYNNVRSIGGDLYNTLNSVNADLYNNINQIEGDRFNNLNQIANDRYVNLRNISSELAANLNNINPNLYEAPVSPTLSSNAWNPNAKDYYVGDTNSYVKAANLPGVGSPTREGVLPTPTMAQDGLNNNITIANGYAIPNDLRKIDELENGTIYKKPGTNTALNNIYNYINNKKVTENKSVLDDYIMPANAEQNVQNYRNRLRGNDYFSNLINGFNY